jgi:hypothetical protein
MIFGEDSNSSPDEQIGDAVVEVGCAVVVLLAIFIGIIATVVKAWL